ncbi:calcium-binding protein [Antarctobacter jejuensis]|uniref:calcium-binding protein n=1 Tax=Antarctobacter jejuensis TaxID=1439938 RepID=UPI003FD0A463
MALVYQSTSTASPVFVTSGNDLIVLDGVNISAPGTAVVLSSGGASGSGLVNYGTITGTSTVNIGETFASITNYGFITAVEGSAFYPSSNRTWSVIDNHGTISASGRIVDSGASSAVLTMNFANYGTLSGGHFLEGDGKLDIISVYNSGGFYSHGIDLFGAWHARVTNTGVMGVSSINIGSPNGGLLVNHGIISGRQSPTLISGDLGDETVINTGEVSGSIYLLAGADRYDGGLEGSVSGPVGGGSGPDTLVGSRSNDLFDGGPDPDLLVGREGADTLLGGTGEDTLFGGPGNDSLDGGNNNDTLNAHSGDDYVAGGYGHDLLVGQDGSDTMDGGPLDDTLDGGSGDDILEGGSGNDILRGRAGEDDLAGGLGRDFLTGGQNADNFVFRSLAETVVGANRDQILDFEQGVDLIVVAGLSPGVFEFRGTAAFAPSGNFELRLIETATGSTIVQLDANGDGTADAEIRVGGVTGLTADDFVL